MTILMAIAPLFSDIYHRLLEVTSYIFWHNLFEFSSIIIAICIFCVSYYSFEQTLNSKYLFLGSMLLLMGFIDFFHTMSFKGMPDFLVPYTSADSATTFWIIARLIGGFGLLVSSVIPSGSKLRINKMVFFITPVVISVIILILVSYYPDVIPTMYDDETGLTDTKILLEYVVIFTLLLAIFFLIRDYAKINDRFSIVLSCALLVGVYSELSFTLYTDVYGVYNFLGHFFKFLMYFVIFRVVFIRNIKQPYLELSAARDEIKNYADNLDKIVEQRTDQINVIHKKLLDDLEYARGIQAAMLPKKLPNCPKVSFEACYYPAERVGGDFYNVFKINETKIGMYIGDVSGHGVSAAMLTVFLNQSISTYTMSLQGHKEPFLPSAVLEKLYTTFNQSDFTNEVYIVMLYGIFDLETKEFTFSSAGLNVAPMIANPSGDVSELVIKGLPICKLPGGKNPGYFNSTVRLHKEEKILFYTDGLTDAENGERIAYSDKRLRALLHKNRHMDASALAKSVSENLFKYIGQNRLQDDVTFFVMEVK